MIQRRDDPTLPGVIPEAARKALAEVLGFHNRPNSIDLDHALREALIADRGREAKDMTDGGTSLPSAS